MIYISLAFNKKIAVVAQCFKVCEKRKENFHQDDVFPGTYCHYLNLLGQVVAWSVPVIVIIEGE